MAKFERFNVDVEGGKNNSARWNIWLRRFDLYIEANEIVGDRKKIANLLTEAGSSIEEIYEAIRNQAVLKKDETYADISKLISDHFAPQKNLNMCKLKFRDTNQLMGENIDSYYVRLKTAAVACEFTKPDDEILLQLIQGCNDKRVKIKASQEVITLENLLKFIHSLEYSSESNTAPSYRKEQGGCKIESVFQVERTSKSNQANKFGKRASSRKCFNCGYDFPHVGECRAKGKTCGTCGKIGHFEKFCYGKNKATKTKNFTHGKRMFQLDNDKTCNKDKPTEHKNEDITQIQESYSIFSISNNNIACPRIKVNILGSTIEVGIDTQASINAITKETFNQMSIKPNLLKDNSIVYSFDGKQPLKSIGKFNTLVYANDKSIDAEFIVFDGVRDNLLSYTTSVDLQLIKLTYALNNKEDTFHKSIVEKYPDLFSGKIGRLKDYKLKIHINKDIKPIIQKERKIPFHLKERIEKAIDKMIKDDIIEPVNGEATPHVSCFVAVPKPSNVNEVRITLDAKLINRAIERERHNMPTVDELKAELNGAKFLSKLDFNGGYHQIEIEEESRYITVFRTPKGLMRYKRLVMGISCASEMFQRAIEHSLNGIQGQKNLIDDCFIWGDSEETHDANLNATLTRIQEKGLTLNPEKCVFKQTELEFFGMKFSKEGIAITDEKIKALKEAKLPDTQSELRSFLGFANFCSDSIPELAINAKLLWKMTHNNKPKKLIWTEDSKGKFEMVKNTILTTALSYFNKKWETVLEVDAGPEGAGAVLYQVEPDKPDSKHIVCFWSQAFSEVEQRYSQVEKEALGVVLACEKFRIYLVGKKFLLYTDNKAVELIYKNPKSNPPARIRRFNLRLMDLEFDIKHKPGKDNMADYLSRNPLEKSITNRETYLAEQFLYFVGEHNTPRAIKVDELMEATKNDQTFKRLIVAIQTNIFPNDPSLRAYRKIKDELSVYQNKLILRGSRIVVPEVLRPNIVKIAHEGHLGIVKTKQLIRERVWFPGIDSMVENEIKQCVPCQLVNDGGFRREPLRMSKFPTNAWEKLQIDFHSLPNGSELMCIIDLCSSFPIVVDVPSTAHHHILPKLDTIFDLMGFPEEIRTDNGPPFQGHHFESFCKNFGIKHIKSTPEWPEANGKVENFNKNMRKLIQKSFIGNADWKSDLNSFLRAYRNAPQCSSGVPPAEMIFVHSNSSKLPLKIGDNRTKSEIYNIAKANDNNSKASMKSYADKKRKTIEHSFEIGDKVLVNQLYNKKVFNKIKSKAANEVFEIKKIKGPMITVFSNNREFTRNVFLFKKAPSTLEANAIDDNLFLNSTPNAEVEEHIENIEQAHEEIAESAILEQPRRTSARVKIPIDRFIAEPACGLRNRQPDRR